MSSIEGVFSTLNELAFPTAAFIQPAQEQPSETKVERSFQFALDALANNVMFCDRDLILRYLNRSSIKTLQSLQEYLQVPVDRMVGNSIHLFHKKPENINAILGASHHGAHHKLPHKMTISLGPVKLDLQVEPMLDDQGEYVGAVVVWGMNTQQAHETLRKAQEAQRNDIEQLNGNLQSVAAATQEIESRIGEIATDAANVAEAAARSRAASAESNASLSSLQTSSKGVAKVAELIDAIAAQINVLALNANIEAARAGIHGRGFTVVANEVRTLAVQTAAATKEIQAKIGEIGSNISTATGAIGRISLHTEELSALSRQLAGAAEDQRVATREMAQNIERAALRTSEIANMRFEEVVP